MAKTVVIYAAHDDTQAQFLAQVLASHEIEAEVTGGALQVLAGYLPATYARPEVRVAEADVERAKPVVAQFERSRRRAMVEKSTDPDASWACPNCGELIEPQFTDCWKCQTPRQPAADGDEDASAAASTPASARPRPLRLPPDPMLTVDLPCIRCDYNLRGLPADGDCPECAFPVLTTLLRTMHGQQEWALTHEPALTPCLDYLEQRLGFPIEAISFVQKVWPRAAALASAGVSETSEPNYDDLAAALRDLALDFLGDPVTAGRAMHRWNLATGQDVQRLVERLSQLEVL